MVSALDFLNGESLVFAYDLSTSGDRRRITPPSELQFGDRFGSEMAVSDNYLAIASSGDDTDAIDSGGVYVYNSDLSLNYRLANPAPSPGGGFGYKLQIVGHTLVCASVSTLPNGYGQVYLFDVRDGRLKKTISQPNTDLAPNFGREMFVIDKYVVISRSSNNGMPGVVYVYSLESGELLTTLTNPTPLKAISLEEVLGFSAT